MPMVDSGTVSSIDPVLLKRLHRALTARKDEIVPFLDDPSMEVLRNLLKNPDLDEKQLLQLLSRRDLTEDFHRALYSSPLVAESHPLKVAMVRNITTPAPIVLALLPHLYLFELVNVCYIPGATPDQKLAAERAIIQRLPATPLGTKITLARRGTATVVEALLQEGDPGLMEACLGNPKLKEAAIFKFLTGPKASAATLSTVARHPKWKTRPNLRNALLKNGNTPLVWYTLFLPTLAAGELRNLLGSPRLTPAQRQAVADERKRRGGV